MKLFSIILLLLNFFFSIVMAQSSNTIENLQKEYESFNYSTVVSEATKLLGDKDRFTDEEIIEISTIKAAAQFAIGENDDTRKSFIEILKLDKSFQLDNISYSPKLILFFQNIKAEFLDVLKLTDKNIYENLEKVEEVNNQNVMQPILQKRFNSSFAKSLLIPGWGHIEQGEQTKGWILTAAGITTLGTALYFIFDTNKKEEDYLSATNKALINSSYDKYNKSYKIRNTLIATYAVIWLYTQMDLLFFSGYLGSENLQLNSARNMNNVESSKINLSLKISL